MQDSLKNHPFSELLAAPKGPLPPGCALPEPRYFDGARQVEALAFNKPEGMIDWYPGPMIGADALGTKFTADGRYVQMALSLLERLEPDAYSNYMKKYYAEGLARFGSHWRYADLVTAVLGLTEALRPRSYLEIGVRRGRSVCGLASLQPDCHLALFDMWLENYAGMDNPGPDFVRAELAKLGYRGNIEFINGNSHETLPAYFAKNPNASFDMITVDGDHTNLGAAQDLADVIPHVAVGGALIFDDVCHPKLLGLGELWERMVVRNRRFSAWTFDDVGYGVGFAIRRF